VSQVNKNAVSNIIGVAKAILTYLLHHSICDTRTTRLHLVLVSEEFCSQGQTTQKLI